MRLSAGNLRALAERFRNAYPEARPFLRQRMLAVEVILHFLSAAARPDDLKRHRDALCNSDSNFLNETTADGHILPRSAQLAESLLATQHVPGFDQYLSTFESDWEQFHRQMQVADVLQRASLLDEMVVPKRRSREDFDFWLRLEGARVPCEAKTKVTVHGRPRSIGAVGPYLTV